MLDFANHGWGGRGAQFREFKPALTASGFQLVVFDHVSHGCSEGVEAPITDFAKGVAAVAKHLKQQRITIAGFIGHSLGCAGIGSALWGELKRLKNIRVVQIAPPASVVRYSRLFAKTLGLSECRRMGGAQRYPSFSRAEMMGIAALHPSYSPFIGASWA